MFKFPLSVELDLTYRCNYNCLYCRNGQIEENEALDFETMKKIIKELKENNIFSINISGGEPLLHKNFVDIIKLLKENNLVWNLTTNGSLIDGKMAKTLKDNNINSLFITLTGMNDELDSYHKGNKNTFSKARKCIENCKKLNIEIYVGYLLTPYNVCDIDNFINFINENGLKAKLMKVKPMGTSLLNQDLYIDDKKYNETIKYMRSLLGNKLIIGEQNERVEDINCMAGVTSCVIGADYNIYPCVMFLGEEKVSCGCIKKDSLYNIWNNSKVLSDFRKPRKLANGCNKCIKKEKCHGGCRGNAYLKTGDYNAVESGCYNDL